MTDRFPSVPSRRSLLAGLGSLVGLAGCLSGSPSGGDSTPGPESTATTATTGTATPTTTVEPCTPSTPAYDLAVPEKPDPLTADAARRVVVAFEKAHRRASVEATYDLSSYSAYVVDRATSVEGTDGGYRVAVKVHADFSSTGEESGSAVTASGGYRYGYRVTGRRFVRDGETLACWGD